MVLFLHLLLPLKVQTYLPKLKGTKISNNNVTIRCKMDDKITGMNMSLKSQARYHSCKSWPVTPSYDDQLVCVILCCQFGCRVQKVK